MMKIMLRSLFAVLLSLSPALLGAQGFNSAGVVPDGRTQTDTVSPNNSNQYLFWAFPGHSYSIEQSRGLNQSILPMMVFAGCSSTYGTYISINDTSGMDPAVNINTGSGAQGQRLAFTCPGPVFPPPPPGPFNSGNPAQAFININNTSSMPYAFSLTVKDTTLQSPRWTAGVSSDTFWTFTNVSSAAVNITVNLLDSNGFGQMFPGLPQPSSPMSVAPGATLSLDTTQIPQFFRTNPPGGTPLAGSVLVAQDGPPGAIVATATIINSAPPAPTIQNVKIEPRH